MTAVAEATTVMPLCFKVVEMLHACNGMTLGKYRGCETFAKYLNFILDSSQNAGCDIIVFFALFLSVKI